MDLKNISISHVGDNNVSTRKEGNIFTFQNTEDCGFCERFVKEAMPTLHQSRIPETNIYVVFAWDDEIFRIVAALKLRGVQFNLKKDRDFPEIKTFLQEQGYLKDA